MKVILLAATALIFAACSENNTKEIADAYCNCRQVEKNEGALQGNKCYEEWDKKYGEIELNENQQKSFLKITQDCN